MMLSELREKVDELCENFNHDTGNIKTELENLQKQSEMKNTLQGFGSRIDKEDDQSEIWKIIKQKTIRIEMEIHPPPKKG